MQSVLKKFTLNNGTKIPSLGLGTFQLSDKTAIKNAIMKADYVHIDAAFVLGNEEILGKVFSEVFAEGKKREDFFITSKIWYTQYSDVEGGIKKSLSSLKLDYVDLYMVHWPLGIKAKPMKPLHQLWPEMEALVDHGYTKSIGLSNFNLQLIWDLLTYAKIKPAVNQIEINPLNSQTDFIKFLLANGIRPVAHTPICRFGQKNSHDFS